MALPVVWDIKHHCTEKKHIYSLVHFYRLVFITALFHTIITQTYDRLKKIK